MNHRLQVALIAAIASPGGLLAGCGTRSDVSLTGNTPAQYSHVWVTVQAVWFNTSATAGPDDSGWDKVVKAGIGLGWSWPSRHLAGI